MDFAYGAYILGPNICQKLLKFPDTNFFIKNSSNSFGWFIMLEISTSISTYVSPLTKMEKQNAPNWQNK